MNKITFPRTSYDGSLLKKKDLETWFTNDTENEIRTRLQTITSANTFMEIRVLNWIKRCLHNIMLANPQKLERITKLVDRWCVGMFREKKNGQLEKTTFGKDIYDAFKYDSYRKNKLVTLAEKLNIKSCPYCNMHYTLFAENGKYQKDKLAKLQFDHFFDKSDYPFLSMSLYNLVPSCAVCNQGKSTGKISLKFHPYVSDIYKQFRFEVTDPLQLYAGAQKDRIELTLAPENATDKELQSYDNVFNILTLYRRHGDIAQEAFDKAYQATYYTDPKLFPDLAGLTQDYLQRLDMGVYADEDDIEKRPMSKYIQDLWKQAHVCKALGLKLRKL